MIAFNPSHGSLSCVKTNCVSFASAQARKLNRSVCFSFPHEVCYFVGVPTMAGHCVSKQIGRHDAACKGYPRRVFLARRKLASGSSRAPCALPNLRCYPRCWLFSCLGLWSHPHISPKEHQKERCGHFSVAALLHYISWCALEYSVVGRISCHDSHDRNRTNVCRWSFAKKFLLLLLLNRIDQ